MHEALAALAADTALTDALGPEFIRVFTTVKTAELRRMREEIPEAETNEYFELY
jgi:glutamine synthetase